VEDDGRWTFLPQIAGKHITDRMMLMQQGQDRLRRARHDAFVFLAFIYRFDVECHATRVLDGEPLDVFFRSYTPQKIVFCLAERCRKKNECSVDVVMDLRTHQEQFEGVGAMRFLDTKIEAVLTKLLAHVTRISARTAIHVLVRQTRQK